MKKGLLIRSILVITLLLSNAQYAFAVSDNVGVDAIIGSGTSSLTVTQASLTFGTITPSDTDHRKAAGPLEVAYFAANGPWEIKVYSDNGVVTGPTALGGLIGADDSTLLALKAWTANYGRKVGAPDDPDCPAGTAPDAEHDASWNPGVVGDGWNYVFDKLNTAKRVLIDQAAEIPSPFDFYLACDAAEMKAQTYGATVVGHPEYGKITVELVIE